jgi:acetoin:2,6-dichlorophenolindophenol oxidoreductase subunit alpha
MSTPAGLLVRMYRTMLFARRFDEAQIRFYKTGQEKMESVHSYIGQEAIGVGAGFAMQDRDCLVPSLRSRPAFFARGVPVQVQWAGVLGRASAPGRGLTGSRHMAALQYGIVGTTGILGAQVPVATGVAMALRAKGGKEAAVCLFGDGAANRGDVHEGMNMASLYKAPVVFLCESNGVAESQEWASYMPIEDLSVRAAGYGMPGVRIDGNDVQAVHAATATALARARAGEGPTFIVADTCRLRGHVEGLPDFRTAEYMQSWKARDPLERCRGELLRDGLATAEELDALGVQVDSEIAAGLEAARAEASLAPKGLERFVFYPEN